MPFGNARKYVLSDRKSYVELESIQARAEAQLRANGTINDWRQQIMTIPFDHELALKLYREGLSDAAIAQRLNTSKSKIWRWRQEQQLLREAPATTAGRGNKPRGGAGARKPSPLAADQALAETATTTIPAEVSEMSESVSEMSESVSEMSESVSEMSESVSEMPESVSEMPESVSEMSESVSEMPEPVFEDPEAVCSDEWAPNPRSLLAAEDPAIPSLDKIVTDLHRSLRALLLSEMENLGYVQAQRAFTLAQELDAARQGLVAAQTTITELEAEVCRLQKLSFDLTVRWQKVVQAIGADPTPTGSTD